MSGVGRVPSAVRLGRVLRGAHRPVLSRLVSSQAALRECDHSVPGLQIEVGFNGVATLRLSDERRRNPLRVDILQRLHEWLAERASEWPEHDPYEVDESKRLPIRAIVLESTGPVWSSGHSLDDFDGASPAQVKTFLETGAAVNVLLRSTPQVTVAAVAGDCMAGGLQLAASCDVLLAHRDLATFSLPGVRAGGYCHSPAVAVGTRVSPRKALELSALGESIDAEEAVRIGLANRSIAADDWRASVDAMASQLAESFSRNSADGKRTLYRQSDAPTLEQKYEIALGTMVDMFGSARWTAYMDRFLKKPK